MSESFEIDIKTFSDTKAVKALQYALNKISTVLSNFISVSDKSTFSSKEQYKQYEKTSDSVDENSDSLKRNQQQQEKSKQSQDDNTSSSKKQYNQLKKTTTQVDLLSSAFQGMGISIGMIATNAISNIPSLIKSSLNEYAEAEVAEIRLQSVLKSTGQAYDGNFERLKKLANQMEISANADGKKVLEMQSIAVAMGVSANQMEEVTKGAVGLAKVYKMDLSLATKASAAAIQGKTELLSRYMPMLSELSTDEEKLAEVQKSQALGYQAAIAEMGTFQASMIALGHSLGALSEVFGEALAPRVKFIANAISSLSRLLEYNKEWIIALTKVFATFIGLLATKKIITFTLSITGLSTAFKKVSMAAALSGKSINLATKSLGAATLAIRGLTVAFNGLKTTVLPLLAISLAVEGIVFVMDKLTESSRKTAQEQKQYQLELDKSVQSNKILLDAELSRLNQVGMAEDDLAIRREVLDAQIKKNKEDLQDAINKNLNRDGIIKYHSELENLAKALDENSEKYIKLNAIETERIRLANEQKSLEEKNLLFTKQRIADEIALLNAKSLGNEKIVSTLERRIKLEDLSRSYQSRGIKDEKEALRLAEKRLKAEEDLATVQKQNLENLEKENKAKAKADFIAEYEIIKARAQGNEVLARSLELKQRANELANRLGVEYKEALLALQKLEKLEKARNKSNNVSYLNKDKAKAQEILDRGEGGTVGKKTIAQAQSIVDGKSIDGDELAIFKGATSRATAINNNDDKSFEMASKMEQKEDTSVDLKSPTNPKDNSSVVTVSASSNNDSATKENKSDTSNSDEIIEKLDDLITAIEVSNAFLQDLVDANQEETKYYNT